MLRYDTIIVVTTINNYDTNYCLGDTKMYIYIYINMIEKIENFGIIVDKYFRNLIESNLNQIVFTIFRLIWIQLDVRLVQ